MSIAVRELDVHDEDQLKQWWETGRDGSDRPADTWPAWEHDRVAVPAPDPEHEHVHLLVHEHDQVVGSAVIELSTLGNQHAAYLDLWILPGHRRRGIGSAVLAEAERRAPDAGRTTVLAEAHSLPGGTSAGRCFLGARGYQEANTEEIKVCELAELAAREESLAALVSARVGDHRVSTCTAIPEEHLGRFCEMLSGFMARIPSAPTSASPWSPSSTGATVSAWR